MTVYPKYKGDKAALKIHIGELRETIAGFIGKPGSVFDWFIDFSEVFGEAAGVGKPESASSQHPIPKTQHPPSGFDIVLANPPYVRAELIVGQKPTLKKVYGDLYSGTADLYCYFYYRALQLLKPGGMMAFISPNKWFRAGYGANLRAHIADTCRVVSITDFGDLPVFESATAYPMIFLAQKSKVSRAAPALTPVCFLSAPLPKKGEGEPEKRTPSPSLPNRRT